MKRIQYDNVIDKSSWPDGPWQHEPDKVQWQAPNTQLPCIVLRSSVIGAWYGYVGVPQGHPLHGMIHDDANKHVEVHGGLTYSATCGPHPPKHRDIARAVYHVTEPDDPELVWLFGFDCAHAQDYSPTVAHRQEGEAGVDARNYRDFAYVTAQYESLARQLAIIEG